jgi:hypothetical protein
VNHKFETLSQKAALAPIAPPLPPAVGDRDTLASLRQGSLVSHHPSATGVCHRAKPVWCWRRRLSLPRALGGSDRAIPI